MNNAPDAPARPRESKNRAYTITLNNPTEQERVALALLGDNPIVQYLVLGDEVGAEGTPHLQGYIRWTNPRTFRLTKAAIGDRAHLEVAKKSAAVNRAYCIKDGSFREWGTFGQQGQRSDITSFCQALKEGSSMRQVSDDMPDVYIKYSRGLELWSSLQGCGARRTWKTEVWVLVGPTGTGKSRWAVQYADNLGMAAYRKPADKWWDKYAGEPFVIFDDFTGCIPYRVLLQVLDRYEMQVEFKGGFAHLLARVIVITSNKLICDWYSQDTAPWNSTGAAALFRRIDQYWYVEEDTWRIGGRSNTAHWSDTMRCCAATYLPQLRRFPPIDGE